MCVFLVYHTCCMASDFVRMLTVAVRRRGSWLSRQLTPSSFNSVMGLWSLWPWWYSHSVMWYIRDRSAGRSESSPMHTHTWQHSHIQFQRRAEAAHAANTQQTRWQVSRPPVFDCGTTFHPDYRPSDWPSTPSDNFWNPTETLVRYWSLTSLNITHAIGSWYMWVVRGEMEWTRAFHNTGRPHNSILRSTYSGHVRSGSLDS